jgi:hypothetical protein
MGSKQSTLLLLITAFLGGFVLMSMELIYPRISIIWFGNVLSVWAIDLSMSLVIIAVGYRIGSWLLKVKKRKISFYLVWIYLFVTCYLLIMSVTHEIILENISYWGVIPGSILFSLIFMLPTMGVLAISGPLLVSFLDEISLNKKSSTSIIFGTSTMGGAISMLVIGLYFLPNMGITMTIYTVVVLLGLNALLIFVSKKQNSY